MEIGNQFIYNAEAESRDDDNARAAYQVFQPFAVQVRDQGIQGLPGAVRIFAGIGCPLLYIGGNAVFQATYTHIIEGFQCADGGGSYGNNRRMAFFQALQQLFGHHKRLPMHGMFAHQGAFHGQKGAGTHMQAHRPGLNPLLPDTLQHLFREMQAGRRSRHRAADMRIEGLVPFRVDLLGFAV